MTEEVKPQEDWMQKRWRPAMGWMYMLVCLCDMVIFPVAWALLQAMLKQPVTQWNPLTLQGAGLFHLAMGAVLGLAAWGRTQEKINGVDSSRLAPVSQSVTTTFGSPSSYDQGMSKYGSPDPMSTPSADPTPITTDTPRPRPRPSL